MWQTISKELKLGNIWEGGQIVDNLQKWIRIKDNWKEIHCFICWEVWKHKNLVIFEDFPINQVRVYNSILQDLGEKKITQVSKLRRIYRPPIRGWYLAVGFFDGASQEKGSKFGAGALLKCLVLGTYRLKMNYGRGTNTRGELLALL